MGNRKASLLAAILPLVVGLGLMYKMHEDQTYMASAYEQKLASMEQEISRYESLVSEVEKHCETDSFECLSSFEHERKKLMAVAKGAEAKAIEMSSMVDDLSKSISELTKKNEALTEELASRDQALSIAQQSLDSRLAAEHLANREEIARLKSMHDKELIQLKTRIASIRRQARDELAQKEQEFQNAHRASVNHLMGMVDSLANKENRGTIPLISLYDAQRIERDFICNSAEHNPTEMPFAKYMDKHWLIWPVRLVNSTQEKLIARTKDGYELHALWENKNNAYELNEGEEITIKFQLQENQICGEPLRARRAALATTSLIRQG